MQFQKIDFENWDRREIYECFRGSTMYFTVHLDITGFLAQIKRQGIRFYPAVIYCVAKVVNDFEEFRYGYDAQKNIGLWDELHPLYTVPRRDKPHLFSMVSTRYNEDFSAFYQAFLEDYARAETCGRLMCDGMQEEHYLGITALPGLHFTDFSFGGTQGKQDLTPFVVLGKYQEKHGRVLLPVNGEFAHEVNDGQHISRFFSELETNFKCLI